MNITAFNSMHFSQMTNIKYVGTSTGTTSATLPAGWSVGDVAVVYVTSNTSASTVPTGWTQFDSRGSSQVVQVTYRVLQSGDTTTGTYTNGGRIMVSVWSGVDTTAPLGVTGNFAAATSSSLTWNTISSIASPMKDIIIMYSNSQSTTLTLESTPTTSFPVSSLANISNAGGEIQGWRITAPGPIMAASQTLNTSATWNSYITYLRSK